MRLLSSFLLLLLPVIRCAEFHSEATDSNEENNSEETSRVSSESQTISCKSDPVSDNIIVANEEFDLMTLSSRNMRRCPYSGMVIPSDEPVIESSSGKCPFGNEESESSLEMEKSKKKKEKEKDSKKKKKKKKSKKSKKKSKKHKKSKHSSSDSSSESSSSDSSLFSSTSSSSSSSESDKNNKKIMKKMKKEMPKGHGNRSDFTQCPYYKEFMANKNSKT